MRLMLPTGNDGAAQAYPLDELLSDDGGLLSLSTALEVKRATGMSVFDLYGSIRSISEALDVSDRTPLIVVLAQDEALMVGFSSLVWLARYHAGERDEGGAPFTLERAADLRMDLIEFVPDPGDGEDETPDPPKPAADGGRAVVGGKGRTRGKTAGRSSKTSGGKS